VPELRSGVRALAVTIPGPAIQLGGQTVRTAAVIQRQPTADLRSGTFSDVDGFLLIVPAVRNAEAHPWVTDARNLEHLVLLTGL
jgi:hypothetical protein